MSYDHIQWSSTDGSTPISPDPFTSQELLECAERTQNKVFVQQLDQTKEDQIQNLTEALRTRNYRIDLLVLNAGIAEHEHPNVNACQIKRCVCAWVAKVLGA